MTSFSNETANIIYNINIPKCYINHITQTVAFGLCCYFRSIFIPRNVSKFSKNLMLLFRGKVTTGILNLVLLILN